MPMAPRIEFYLDTNVILDWLDAARGNRTSEFIRDRIRAEKDFLAVVSTFALMEAVQQHQDNDHFRSLITRGYVPSDVKNQPRELTPAEAARCYADVYRLVQSLKPKVVLREIDATEIWAEATSLQQKTNFSAPDAIHVAVAIATGCDFFVTADQQLLREMRKLPRRPTSLFSIQTQRGDVPQKFEAQFAELVRRARKRRAARPKKKVPKEIQDLVGAVRPIFNRETDPKTFVKKYEIKLRRSRTRKS
jgi:predicted nucleic acid-binding protein